MQLPFRVSFARDLVVTRFEFQGARGTYVELMYNGEELKPFWLPGDVTAKGWNELEADVFFAVSEQLTGALELAR